MNDQTNLIPSDQTMQDKQVVIIGAGPAGLTASYELCQAGFKSLVIEKDQVVGGISRTVAYKGFLFDLGGHRFFTKVQVVENLWRKILGTDFIRRQRLSRIYYNKKFFYYPLRPFNALFGLGVINSIRIIGSYLWAQLFPSKDEKTFKQWVCNHFGNRLYQIFFKTYTEKVWGLSCSQISAEWAAQRIRGLSLITAIKNALLKAPAKTRGEVIKTLIDAFDYPRLGPGMMWEKTAALIQEQGGELRLNTEVDKIYYDGKKITGVGILNKGRLTVLPGTDFISTMPIRELIVKFSPPPPGAILQEAAKLNYRDFLTVALVIDHPDVFPDNWIYIHDNEVKVGRIQNFKNWSPDMVPDDNKTCLGLEYFCFEGDGLWNSSDADLIELGKNEIVKLGLIKNIDWISDGMVVRMPKAYPVYDSTYGDALSAIRDFLEPIANLQLVGRNGMHKYNNQDHSMLTAMLAVKNICGANYDIWAVNSEQEYHEELKAGESGEETDINGLAATQPLVPEIITIPEAPHPMPELLILNRALARFDKLGMAIAMGIVGGLWIFILTLYSWHHGIQFPMALLRQYFIGYRVSPSGAMIGMTYGFFFSFVWGWFFAYIYNFIIGIFVFIIKKKSEILTYRDILDHI